MLDYALFHRLHWWEPRLSFARGWLLGPRENGFVSKGMAP